MTYEEMQANGRNIEILPCIRMECKGAVSRVLNLNAYMNVYEFEEQVMKYMCNMRPVMDEFICVALDGIEDRPVDYIQSLVESYIRYDGLHIKKNYRVEYGALDKEGKNHIYLLESPDGACDYDMAVSVFAMVCIEGKFPSDWRWKEITEEAFAQNEQMQYRNPISKKPKKSTMDKIEELQKQGKKIPVMLWNQMLRELPKVPCPNCGSKNTYERKYKSLHWVHGEFTDGLLGESLSDNDPRYHCNDCGEDFGYLQ